MFRLCSAVVLLAVAAHGIHRVPRLPTRLSAMPKYAAPLEEGKIVGGHDAQPGQFPFQVSWQTSPGFNSCGGAILDAETILTAAHCCRGIHGGNIIAGEHSLSEDSGEEQTRGISHHTVHEHYSQRTFENDICLLKLDSPLELGGNVGALTLPSAGQQFSGDATVSGWGTTSSGGPAPDILQYVKVPIVDDATCTDNYNGEVYGDVMICAGEGGKDSCQGDSGGPMTCNGKHCGIVSWGYGCADPNYPGVYAETSAFIDWIATHQ